MKIKNLQTGFVADKAPEDWATSGVYDTKIWQPVQETSIPEINSGKTNPVYSSNEIDENITQSGNQINKAEKDLEKTITDSASLVNDLQKKFNEQSLNLNTLTSGEIQDIANYANSIGTGYQSSIEEAKASKTEGLGKSEIGYGRVGGFMNTQAIGTGATGAGTLYGAGGQLEKAKSAYDLNIADLEAKKVAAVAAAKQAREEYIRTGKSTALNAVKTALELAQNISTKTLELQNSKADLVAKLALNIKNAKATTLEDTTTALSNMAQAGLDASNIPVADKTKYEESLGLPAGTFDKFYEDILTAAEFAKEGRYADLAAKRADIQSKLPLGTSIKIGNETFTGTGTASSGAKTSAIQEYEYAKEQGYIGSFEDYQNDDANRKQKALGAAGLDSTTQNQIIAAGNKFSSQPVVQRFAKAVEAQNFVETLANKDASTLSSVDAQGLIYAFAKAMDPDSVVREGEYATAQKYAQSWLNAFGFDVQRILEGKSFLSPQAVQAIKSTVTDKYSATKKTYDAEYNKSKTLIDSLSGGKVDPSLYLTDYSGASTIENSGNAGGGTGDVDWNNL